MSKGAKTTTKSSVPPWLSAPLQGLTSQITAAGAVDPQSRIAGSNPLLDKAMGSLTGAEDPRLASLLSAGTGGAAGVGYHSGLDNLDKWMNPYTDKVVNTALSDFDVNAGQTRAQQSLDMAGSGAFGGSGSALTRSMTEGELARARAATDAGLRSDAFNTSANYSNQDASRFTQADVANQQASESAASRALQGFGLLSNANNQTLNNQMQFGDYQRQMENEKLNADWTNLSRQASLYQPLGSLFQQQTSTTKPGVMDYISTGAGIAAMFSDERLKTDIQRVGTRPDGLGIYLYRYIWGPMLFVGVMAQEVLKVRPDAVAVHPSGFLMVDYGVL